MAHYCPEPLSDAAQRAVRSARPPAVSRLAEVEFCSAVSLKTRTGDMDVDSATRVLSLFRSHLAGGLYRIVPIEAAEYTLAADWIASFSTPFRTLDALHLATACSHGLMLITADKALAQAADHFAVDNRCLA